jgi:hypothetical protein
MKRQKEVEVKGVQSGCCPGSWLIGGDESVGEGPCNVDIDQTPAWPLSLHRALSPDDICLSVYVYVWLQHNEVSSSCNWY